MSADELDLDAVTAMHEDRRYSDEFLGRLARTSTVPALVAEVRRLRADNARLLGLVPRGILAPYDPNADYECCASGSCEVCRG